VNCYLLVRLISVILLGIVVGYFIDNDDRKTRQMDRQQYLAREALKFDESKSDPVPTAAMIIGGVILLGLFAGAYEGVVLLISFVSKPKNAHIGKPTGDASIPFS